MRLDAGADRAQPDRRERLRIVAEREPARAVRAGHGELAPTSAQS